MIEKYKFHCSLHFPILLSLALLNSAQAATVSGTVKVRGNDAQTDCSISANGEGTTVYGFDCSNDKSRIVLDKVPSTSKILISERDCSKSTSGQGWWVELQATNRLTSSLPLSIKAIVDEAGALQPGADDFVAPGVRILDKGVSSPSGQARCVALTLPTLDPSTRSIAFNPEPTRGTTPGHYSNLGRCGSGAMTSLYSIRKEDFSFQCSGPIRDDQGLEYVPDQSTTIEFNIKSAPIRCPANMAITEMMLTMESLTPEKSHISCRSFKAKTGKTLALTENSYQQRKVDHNGHNVICEGQSNIGSVISQPANLITGFDMDSSGKTLTCSTMSLPK